MILSVIKKAVGEALLSTHQHQVGAVIFNKKIVVSSGRNYSCRSAKHLHPRFMRWQGSIHAEADAIIKARCDLRGYSMFVIRINNNGEFRMALSCHHCLDYLAFVGIKKLYFSTNSGTIEQISVKGGSN